MNHQLEVFNPSDMPRGGIVTAHWQRFRAAGAGDRDIEVVDDQGRSLPTQVDVIDPTDRKRDLLLFHLIDDLPPGYGYSNAVRTFTLRKRTPPDRTPDWPKAEAPGHGVRLVNSLLNVFISLTAEHIAGRPWYAGAATSVIRGDFTNYLATGKPAALDNGLEMLDAFNATFVDPKDHDVEKRCMQIDLVRLSRPAWDGSWIQSELLAHDSYELITRGEGPVGAFATIASRQFAYEWRDPVTKKTTALQCRLYRSLSIRRDDAVFERVWVRGVPAKGDAVDLFFTARYFAYMDMDRDMGRTRWPIHHRHIPDWLAIGTPWPNQHGYGFATDVHALPVMTPHPEYPHKGAAYRTFSFELDLSDGASCIHLFKQHLPPDELAAHTGRAWYYHIYQPLRAV